MSASLEHAVRGELQPGSTGRVVQDLVVGLCGLVTCMLTALMLDVLDGWTGLALYGFSVWGVVPVGACLTGFLGASGYYAGAKMFGHRPGPMLLTNSVLASLSTFLVIHYLGYISTHVKGVAVADTISFPTYLDLIIRATSLVFDSGGKATPALGGFGYVHATLQVIGFAAGGWLVYRELGEAAYCDRCSRYLISKGVQERYSPVSDHAEAVTSQVLAGLSQGDIREAILGHAALTTRKATKTDKFETRFAVEHCPGCGRHWYRFTVSARRNDEWHPLPDMSWGGVVNKPLSLRP